ncbi:MAG: AbrB/MazE/SpoVT family DNA-binding domain-containing protein [Eubacteriales bacterium]|nr:AbrB/MazE/SpoVT family DNA-binding domain-containing protein [Eubacteriales bacterium]
MKATGIVRKVDELGRIVLPKELRTVLDIEIKDPVEIFTEDEYIVLKKYNPSCCLCGSMENLRYFKDKKICQKCIDSFKEQ